MWHVFSCFSTLSQEPASSVDTALGMWRFLWVQPHCHIAHQNSIAHRCIKTEATNIKLPAPKLQWCWNLNKNTKRTATSTIPIWEFQDQSIVSYFKVLMPRKTWSWAWKQILLYHYSLESQKWNQIKWYGRRTQGNLSLTIKILTDSISPEMGSRISSEEDQRFHWIYICINPSGPCCQSFSKGL